MNDMDSTRLDQFRQIKKEIRGSRDYLIVGIDVAKSKHYAFFGTATGKTLLKRMIFENNIAGFDKLLTHEDSLKVKYGLGKVIYVCEGVKSTFDCFDFLTGLQMCFWLVIFKRICDLNPPEAYEGFISRPLGDYEYSN